VLPNSTPPRDIADDAPLRGTADDAPLRGTADDAPLRGTADDAPLRGPSARSGWQALRQGWHAGGLIAHFSSAARST
jgi:hypothetical protein